MKLVGNHPCQRREAANVRMTGETHLPQQFHMYRRELGYGRAWSPATAAATMRQGDSKYRCLPRLGAPRNKMQPNGSKISANGPNYTNKEPRGLNQVSFKLTRRLLIAGIVVLAVLLAFGISRLKPPPKTEPIGDVELLVEVLELQTGSYQFRIESQGTVRPLVETVLSAEVSGSVLSVSQKFVAGGVFAAGEELMQIDPTNYIGAVAQAEALVNQRQIEYDGAKKLRTQGYRAEAELASAAAALADANAALIRTKRDLDRTRIRLPYEGMVRSRTTNIGEFVSPGKQIGVVFATDFAEIRLPLTDQDLAFVDLPDASEITASGISTRGPEVLLSAVQKGRVVQWFGRIVRSEGVVDERARMTYAVARVSDPYKLHAAVSDESPLPMGTFVQASIEGASIEGAVRLPRSSIRRNNEVIFVDGENRLRLEPVQLLRTDSQYAYIEGASVAGKRVSATAIESPINGMKVRTTDDPPTIDVGDEPAATGNGQE